MAKDKLKKSHLTAFTPGGDYMAVLSPNGIAKVSLAFLFHAYLYFDQVFLELFSIVVQSNVLLEESKEIDD